MVVDLVKDAMRVVERISGELGDAITPDDYYVEDLGCPHLPPKRLPAGYSAVYFFVNETTCDNEVKYVFLKIGKANELSNARFTSQHYGFNAKSTLAKSLCNDPEFTSMGINSDNAKDWITGNLRRVNILIKAEKGKAATELMEAVMHYAFRPKYEGAL